MSYSSYSSSACSSSSSSQPSQPSQPDSLSEHLNVLVSEALVPRPAASRFELVDEDAQELFVAVNTNEIKVDVGLFTICSRVRAEGAVVSDKCRETEGEVRVDSVKVFVLLFVAILIEICAICCFLYLLWPAYRRCCDMLGSESGDREWYAGCVLLAVAATILVVANLVYYAEFNEAVEQYNKEATIIDPDNGYGRFSYSFFLIVAAAVANWVSILFIVYEVVLTRRTRESRIVRKRNRILADIERTKARKAAADARARDSGGKSPEIGAVASKELDRQRRREERAKKAEARRASRVAFVIDESSSSSS
ncbi:uncharacterized protein AMSG_04218 [Thecamonas trahens ATCC 50062]|uniref:Uncharacterized protein n=1 Tax=Thecamonas trahens ATCC 50062 TaxID=461836 RepID=A0A0L0D9L1_THETB|nr:hypothetical protein AMSG_04218 [Thecamonas trahens ATCC 50062]KNC47983.1 hypothetical protein AMSG_04218 [Thecamonas trahens ATCC 50062]|eukprot:XP_013759000.1 hypothetical protein AMSG_04218 [Thecamonas trahens ATCC 50062]